MRLPSCNVHELFGFPSMRSDAAWHFWAALIFQCHDHQLIMRAAWIISLHFVEASSSETHSAPGLWVAGEPKNTISQVVPHELKIQEHGFPVRQNPLIPPAPLSFMGGGRRSSDPGRKEIRKRYRNMTHNSSWLTPPSLSPKRPYHAATVIEGCFHNVLPSNFCRACHREVWIRRLRHLSAAALAGCHEARGGTLTPTPPVLEPFIKRGN